MSIAKSPWLLELLEAKATYLKYHAYYKGIRHNHKLESAVAIARLGGTKEYVEKFFTATEGIFKSYTGEGADEEELLECDFLKSDKLEDYRGKNQAFYKMLSMYTKLYDTKYKKDIQTMIKDVCPDIIDGPLFSSFHGIIQIAYGLVANCDQGELEGITFMDQQYSPLFLDDLENKKRDDLATFGHGKRNIFDILSGLTNINLIEQLNQENKKDTELRKETHMYGTYGWPGPKYHSEFFMDLANDVKLPDWFIPEEKNMQQLEKLIGWLIDVAVEIYVKSNSVNDFFLLHGITASWSASKVLPILDFDSALLGFRSLVSALLITYVIQDGPGLERKAEEYYTGPITIETWEKIIIDMFQNQSIYEFHVYKAIQCLYERWLQNSKSTPECKFYVAGAKIVLNYPYSRGGNFPFTVPNTI